MGLVHIYCGDGKGKTSSAVGLSIRALGSGMSVGFCQFFKNGSSGEIKILKKLERCTYIQPEKSFPLFMNMTDSQKVDAQKYYTEYFNSALLHAKENDVLVFDEIISTCNFGMLDIDYVVKSIEAIKNDCEIILTGRDPDTKLIQLADYICEIKNVRHPFDTGIIARKGIEY